MWGARNNKNSLYKSIVIILLLTILLTAVTYSNFIADHIIQNTSAPINHIPSEQFKDEDYPEQLKVFNDEIINIVFLGFDRSISHKQQQDLYRPDSIMVFSINLLTSEVNVVSIPRDSFVKIHNECINDKINHAYKYGYFQARDGQDPHQIGLRTTFLTIQDFLGGVPLHEYVVIDIDGAAIVIDAIGGIYYEVDIVIPNKYNQEEPLLEKGYQLLDGRQFMNYVRNRATNQGGEMGRIERQQRILLALFKQLKENSTSNDIYEIYKGLSTVIETELSFTKIASLSVFALRVNPVNIKTHIFTGQGKLSYWNGKNVWLLLIDEKERVKIIKEAFKIDVSERQEQIIPEPLANELLKGNN